MFSNLSRPEALSHSCLRLFKELTLIATNKLSSSKGVTIRKKVKVWQTNKKQVFPFLSQLLT